MIKPVRLYEKLAYQLNAKDYAKALNETAKRSKKFAHLMLSEAKINRAITQKDVIKMCNRDVPGTYDGCGNLTQKGSNMFIASLRSLFNLKSDDAAKLITVKQLITKTAKIANAGSKTLKVQG